VECSGRVFPANPLFAKFIDSHGECSRYVFELWPVFGGNQRRLIERTGISFKPQQGK